MMHILSLSLILLINFKTDFFAISNLLILLSTVEDIEPDISINIQISIGSRIPVPSYFDFVCNPIQVSLSFVNGLIIWAQLISILLIKFFSFLFILK